MKKNYLKKPLIKKILKNYKIIKYFIKKGFKAFLIKKNE